MRVRFFLRPTVASVTVLFALATVALSQSTPHNPVVAKRIEAMMQADGAIRRLSAMTTGGALFDQKQASRDRRALIRTTRAIPGLFRRPSTGAPSRASFGIWHRWDEFRARAKQATRAARHLDTQSRATLQQGLPYLVRACLQCHDQFRLNGHFK